MLADIVLTRHVMSSGMIQTTESDDMSGRHSQHFQDMSACWRTTCRLGGVPRHDTTPTFPTKTVCTRVGELCDDNQPTQRPMNRPTMRPTAGGSKAEKATTMPIVSKSGKVGNSAKSHKD